MKVIKILLKSIKISIDLAMTVLFLLLMGYHLLDGSAHEELGISLFVLFIIHNALNYKWYLSLFKGRYNAVRILQTTVNAILWVAMICCIASSMCISGHVFTWTHTNMMVGRKLHLMSTVWVFIIMSIHLGLHWSHFVGIAKKISNSSNTLTIAMKWISRLIVLGICIYGCYNFVIRKLWEEMFLFTEFKWFDYDKSLFLYFIESLSIMILFTSVGYYLKKCILYIRKTKFKSQTNLHE